MKKLILLFTLSTVLLFAVLSQKDLEKPKTIKKETPKPNTQSKVIQVTVETTLPDKKPPILYGETKHEDSISTEHISLSLVTSDEKLNYAIANHLIQSDNFENVLHYNSDHHNNHTQLNQEKLVQALNQSRATNDYHTEYSCYHSYCILNIKLIETEKYMEVSNEIIELINAEEIVYAPFKQGIDFLDLRVIFKSQKSKGK